MATASQLPATVNLSGRTELFGGVSHGEREREAVWGDLMRADDTGGVVGFARSFRNPCVYLTGAGLH
jgi:hypothetical protein